MNLEKHIIPVFGDMKLNRITVKMIDSWLLSFLEKGYSGSMANQCLSALHPVFSEAQREGLISGNPAEKIKPLKIINEKKSILTKDEFIRLFDPDKIALYWIQAEYYVASLLAACTGMRLGEVQALRGADLIPGYVRVCHSWDRKYGLKDTKTHDSREIPIYPGLYEMLQELKREKSGGFLFSGDGGKTPFYYTSITDAFYKALAGIGIKEEQRGERNITFHSWRHFFNSRMRGKIADHLLQRLTGHKTLAMTEHYTHVERNDLQDMVAIQESFFIPGPGLPAGEESQGAAYAD